MPGVGPRISHQHSTPVPRRAGEPSAPAHAHRAACPAVEGGARALQALLVFTRAGARCDWTTSKLGGYPSVCHPCVGNGISRGSPARGAGLKDLGSRGCMQTAGLCNQEAALGPPVAAAASCNSAPGAPEGSLGCADPRQCPEPFSGHRNTRARAHQLLLELSLSPSPSCSTHHPHTNADITGQRRCSSNTK